MNNRFGPVQMSPKPDHLSSNSLSLEREPQSHIHHTHHNHHQQQHHHQQQQQQHHHHHQQQQHRQQQLHNHLHPHPLSHSSIQSLPVPSSSSGGRFIAPLPALQDPRYSVTASTSSGYETSSPTPTSAASSIAYSPFNNGFQPTSYPIPTSSSFSYSLTPHDSRPRIPSIQSPTPGMVPHNRSSSGSTKSVSPSLGSSVRTEYTTSTPGLSRHHHPMRGPQSEMLGSPHSPITAVSPTMGSLASPGLDHSSNGLGVNTAGPPLGETVQLQTLTSADGHQIRPEIHARVDKGFFLSDRDWTCYRRNYFSVICSYSLLPTPSSLPLYLRRVQSSQPEHILSFAMCISAVVDAPGGKTVELVQHTPKRDKGPQHKPIKVKLSPQPSTNPPYTAVGSSPVVQQVHGSQSQVPLDHDYSFPQQTQQQQQHQQQHIAVFDRIQFKSATANNGKRRAAQQYYHLIVELYADVGGAASSAPGPGGEEGWIKIAQRVSAPMVVRGRSPGHYADERRQSSASSPGGGGGTGGNAQSSHRAPSHTSGGPGYMGSEGMSSGGGHGGSNQGMNNMQHVASPPTSSVNQHSAASISSASPVSHYTPIDPTLGDPSSPQIPPFDGYTYVPSTLYQSAHLPPPPSVDSGYETTSYNGDRKSEHPLDTSCPQYENEMSAYIPSTVSSVADSFRKTIVKEEFPPASTSPWLGTGALGRDQRFGPNNNLFTKCGRFQTAETSKGYYPDIPPL